MKLQLQQIEQEAVQLTEEERAKQLLLLSFDSPSEVEIRENWFMEACNRAHDLDKGTIQPIPAEEVRCKAQALLR